MKAHSLLRVLAGAVVLAGSGDDEVLKFIELPAE
jgi:hypothetical protein